MSDSIIPKISEDGMSAGKPRATCVSFSHTARCSSGSYLHMTNYFLWEIYAIMQLELKSSKQLTELNLQALLSGPAVLVR